MCKVKVHPNKTMVNAGITDCVSITPDVKYGRAYYMGTVYLKDVAFRIHASGLARARKEQQRNVHAWAVGTLLGEQKEQFRPTKDVMRNMVQVTYHYNIGRFVELPPAGFIGPPRDVTDMHFRAAIVVGRDFYVSKEW